MSFQEKSAHDGQAAAWEQRSTPSESPTVSKPKRPPKSIKPAAQIGNFGGRQRRYEVNKQQLLRSFDPFDCRYVTFANEREYRAWLQPRFDPDVRELNVAPVEIAYRRLGKKFVTKPLMEWQRADGSKVCVWLKESWPAELSRAYEHFAVTHKVEVVLKTWEDLERQEVLLENLESARQLMSTAINGGVDMACVCDAVELHLRRYGDSTRGEIGAQLSCEGCLGCAEHLDAALFFFHGTGVIQLDLVDAAFGDDTAIRLL